MRIAFDVDGVLNDVDAFLSSYGARYFERRYKAAHGISRRGIVKGIAVNPNGYGVREVFGCTPEEETAFWARHALRFLLFWPPRRNAARVLRALRREGHEVWIVSSRPGTCEHGMRGALMRLALRLWLMGNRFEYDGVEFCPEEADAARKRETCARRGVDVMVEDKWENVDEIRKSATVLCFLSRANALFEAENVVRVDNFSGLHRQIQRIGQSRAGGGKTGGDLPCGESA